jgi:hypothetical protein
VVSGGHTSIVVMDEDGVFRELGGTIDDAAGEAFDKIARYLGLPFPGGPEIDRLAREGDRTAFDFPRALLHDGTYRLSLSGLKTAVIRELRRMEAAGEETVLADVAASFQEAIVDVQVVKTLRAAAEQGLDQVVLAGGVAANSRLRERFAAETEANGQRLIVPSIPLCTDNGAMVAASGANLLARVDRRARAGRRPQPPARRVRAPAAFERLGRRLKWRRVGPGELPTIADRCRRGPPRPGVRPGTCSRCRRSSPSGRAAAARGRRPPLGARGGVPRAAAGPLRRPGGDRGRAGGQPAVAAAGGRPGRGAMRRCPA